MKRPSNNRARRARRQWQRRILLGVVAVLYVVSIPWYRTAAAPLVVVLGVPDWVLVSFVCYVGAAVANAAAWLLADIRDRDEPEDEPEYER